MVISIANMVIYLRVMDDNSSHENFVEHWTLSFLCVNQVQFWYPKSSKSLGPIFLQWNKRGEFEETPIWLVVGPPLWKRLEFVNWDDEIPNMNGKIQKMATKPPTSFSKSSSILVFLHHLWVHPPVLMQKLPVLWWLLFWASP